MTPDKLAAYDTLYTTLDTLARLIAPVAPFYADQLYNDLHPETEGNSVHLADYPTCDESLINKELEESMALAMNLTSMVLSLRKKVKIPVIQALNTISVPATDPATQARIEQMASIILAETNVKQLNFISADNAILVKKVKCNFRTMGKKFGKQMKAVAAAVDAMTQAQISELEQNGTITLSTPEPAVIEREDVEIFSEDIPGWTVANEGALTVALDITITEELAVEGNARKIVKEIQNLRKTTGLNITDRIKVTLADSAETQAVLAAFAEHIKTQVLAVEISLSNELKIEKI